MDNPTIKPMIAPFKKFCMSIGALPSSYKDSLDYYETLLCLIKYLEDTIIPVVNNNGEAVTELQNLYIELKNYVEHYFDNLDVQEQIDNILDRIVEIDNILDRIVKDEEVTQEQIDNILNRMVEYEELTQAQLDESNNQVAKAKMVYNALPKVSDEGDNLTLDGTANCPMKMELKGNTEQTTYTGKNLFDNNTLNINKGITSDGSLGDNTALSTSDYIAVQSSTNYFLSNVVGSVGRTCAYYDSNKTFISAEYYSGDEVINKAITTPSNAKYMRVAIKNGTENTQVEAGTTATSYEPYVGGTPSPSPDYPQDVRVVTGDNTIHISNSDNTISQEYLLSLGSIELCKIETYQDYIYKDNGKWYKHSEIGKVVLDGSESWARTSINVTGKYRFYCDIGQNILSVNANTTGLFYSDKFIGITRNQSNIGVNGLAPTDPNYIYKSFILYYDYVAEMSVDDFKTWLSTHNTIVYYVLATPTNEEITDTTLISQLNAIEKAVSYDTQTNIVQEYYSEPFIINAECVRSLKDIFELIGNS